MLYYFSKVVLPVYIHINMGKDWGVAQEIECLSSKYKVLSSVPGTSKTKTKLKKQWVRDSVYL
jgi:hypothetical protein